MKLIVASPLVLTLSLSVAGAAHAHCFEDKYEPTFALTERDTELNAAFCPNGRGMLDSDTYTTHLPAGCTFKVTGFQNPFLDENRAIIPYMVTTGVHERVELRDNVTLMTVGPLPEDKALEFTMNGGYVERPSETYDVPFPVYYGLHAWFECPQLQNTGAECKDDNFEENDEDAEASIIDFVSPTSQLTVCDHPYEGSPIMTEDRDVFEVELERGAPLKVWAYHTVRDPLPESWMELEKQDLGDLTLSLWHNGVQVAEAATKTSDEAFLFVGRTSGTYYIRVEGAARGGQTNNYTLKTLYNGGWARVSDRDELPDGDELEPGSDPEEAFDVMDLPEPDAERSEDAAAD